MGYPYIISGAFFASLVAVMLVAATNFYRMYTRGGQYKTPQRIDHLMLFGIVAMIELMFAACVMKADMVWSFSQIANISQGRQGIFLAFSVLNWFFMNHLINEPTGSNK